MQKKQCRLHTSFRFSVPSPELCDARDVVEMDRPGPRPEGGDCDGGNMGRGDRAGMGKPEKASSRLGRRLSGKASRDSRGLKLRPQRPQAGRQTCTEAWASGAGCSEEMEMRPMLPADLGR